MGGVGALGAKLASLSSLSGIKMAPVSPQSVLYRSRLAPMSWNFVAGYAKSAEEKLGLDKPKKPVSSFLRFTQQIRSSILQKNPNISSADVLKTASKDWQQLDQASKDKLNKQYVSEMEQYKKSKAAFESSLTKDQKEDIRKMTYELAVAKEKRKLKAEIKELGKPKKPMSSYLLFCQTEKDNIKNVGMAEFQLQMKEKWYNLPLQEKEKFEKIAHELKEKYRKELTKWEEKMIKMGNLDFVRNRSLPAKTSSGGKRATA